MNVEYENLFATQIAEPLQRVTGKPLQSVVYYMLSSDYPYFDIDSPNTTGGCQGIRLHFAGAEVELDWDWQNLLRGTPDDLAIPTIYYHLVARSSSERQARVCTESNDDSVGWDFMDATKAKLWESVRGETLQGVIVWGVPLPEGRNSPQVVGLQFPSAQIVFAVGMTGDMSIGDGDEMLVFSESEWTQRLSEQAQSSLVVCWSTGDPIR